MSNLQPPWDLYLGFQTKLKDSATVDEASWAREAQLNRIIEPGANAAGEEVARVARSQRRLERYRARLRRQYLSGGETPVDGEAVVESREQLLIVQDVTGDGWALLADLAEGASYNEISAVTGLSGGALRVRAQRARRKIVALVA